MTCEKSRFETKRWSMEKGELKLIIQFGKVSFSMCMYRRVHSQAQVRLLFYIIDDLVCRVRLTHGPINM